MSKMNKDIAGYHLLMILSQSDQDFNPEEGKIMIKFLNKQFPFGGNFDEALDVISNLSADMYESHFEKVALMFLEDSNEKERLAFLKFAMKLINADKKVVVEEDHLITKLFHWWDM